MYKFISGACLWAFLAIPAHAQTLFFAEDFEGGDADWVDVDRNTVSHVASGGHDGGAYISMTGNINTSSGGNFGGYVQFRCAVAPSQLPSQDCSSGNFVGNWYLDDGVQELRFWFRHNSSHPGGIQPTIRIAVPGNQVGGSALLPAAPANTWTEVVVPIDPQSGVWDSNWGSLTPNAVQVLKNVGRLQPGIYFDPDDPTYTESNVTFDLDDVSISGTPPIAAVIKQVGQMHPHHNGGPGAVAGLDDPVNMIIIGQLQSAGDAEDLDTDDIVRTSLRIGQLGGVPYALAKGLNNDGDGIDDARARVRMSETGSNCDAAWTEPTEMAVRGELLTGELFTGVDTTLNKNCNAQCH